MRYLIFLFALAVGACTPMVVPPVQPNPVVQDCLGDIDKDGAVSTEEVKMVTLFKFEGLGDKTVILPVVDTDGNGLVDDSEFTKVVMNNSGGRCVYVK